MISKTRTFLNFGLFVILVIGSEYLRGTIVNCEETFHPSRLPRLVKSQVEFSQYGKVPMLSLDEIQRGFPWLEIAAESKVSRRSIEHTTPRYVFYYVPTEVILEDHRTARRPAFYPGFYEGSRLKIAETKNSLADNINDQRFYVKSNQKLVEPSRELPPSINQLNWISQSPRFSNPYGDYRDQGQSEEEIRSAKGGVPLPKNHKYRERDFAEGSKSAIAAGTKSVPNYLYPKVPSPYMELPKLKFEEKEFWVKNKRKSKRPHDNLETINEERLKNHRIAKKKKSKKLNSENEMLLKNHKATYDREHDPEERVESSSIEAKRLHKRPNEIPKNPLLLSEDGERVEFQIHGHEGPQTYIFGFDTGDGENRHFRLEERLRDGSVKGHYGYYDSNGKLKMVEYKARPMEGYEEKHHNSNGFDADEENKDVDRK